ncbi:hypothetical protein C0J52_05375 [Blattella germanica]|nr:hypothetical protein C0J52_05375 [Blattella germanica]
MQTGGADVKHLRPAQEQVQKEDTLFKLRIRIREQDTLIATLKNLCRDRRKKVLALESQLQCSSKAEGRIPRPSVHAEIQTDSTYLQDYKLQKMENIRYLQRENSLLNKACQQKQNEAHKLEKSVSRNTAPLSTLDQNPEIRESQHKKKDI